MISGDMNNKDCDLSLHFMLEHSFHLLMMMNWILKGCMYNGIFFFETTSFQSS